MGIEKTSSESPQISEPRTHGELRNVLLQCEEVRRAIIEDPERDSKKLQSRDAELLLVAFTSKKNHGPDAKKLTRGVRLKARMLLQDFGVLQKQKNNPILMHIKDVSVWLRQVAGIL